MHSRQAISTDEHLVDTLADAAAAVLLGFQSVFFGVAAMAFVIREGLLPEDESFDRWFKFVTRETGLIVGALLVLVGLGAAAAEKPGGALRTNQSSQF